MFCLDCGKEIGNISKNRICPYCGLEQYEKPSKKAIQAEVRRAKGQKEKLSNKKNDEINQWFDMGLF